MGGLIGIATAYELDRRSQDDQEVEAKIPVVDVPEIELHPPLPTVWAIAS